MYLDETEGRNDCAGESHQQFNRPTDRISTWSKVEIVSE
jgi:hypothetical protein